MSRTVSVALTALVCLFAAAGLAACGGGSSSSATATATQPDIGQIPAGSKLLKRLRARAVASGVSRTAADCVITSLRASLTPQDLAKLLQTHQIDTGLQQKLAAAGHSCAGK